MRFNFLHLFGPEPRNGEPVIETALKQAVEAAEVPTLWWQRSPFRRLHA